MRKNTRKKKEKILKRDSFIFYRSFAVALEVLNYRQAYNVLKAIINYGLDGIEEELKPMEKAIFELIKPQLKANNARYVNICKRWQKAIDDDTKPIQNPYEPDTNPIRNEYKVDTNENDINANVNVNLNVNANANDINANANARRNGASCATSSCSDSSDISESEIWDKSEKTKEALEKMGIRVDCEIPPDFGVRKIEILRIAIESSAMLKKWRKFSAFLRNWEDVASGKYSDPPPKRDDNFMRHNYTPEQLASVCVNFDEIDDLDWE